MAQAKKRKIVMIRVANGATIGHPHNWKLTVDGTKWPIKRVADGVEITMGKRIHFVPLTSLSEIILEEVA